MGAQVRARDAGDVEDRIGPGGVQPQPQIVLGGGDDEAVRADDGLEVNDVLRGLRRTDRPPQGGAESDHDVDTRHRRGRLPDPVHGGHDARCRPVQAELEVMMGAGAEGEDPRLRARHGAAVFQTGRHQSDPQAAKSQPSPSCRTPRMLLAMRIRWTASGPSANRSTRAVWYMRARGRSPETPAAPQT